MKLEAGMYVRYKYEEMVFIGKITFISEVMCGLDETLQIDIDNCMEEILKKDIIKARYNITDLIEVGDVVELFTEDDIDKENTNIFELVAITDDKKEIGVFNSDFQIEFFPIESLRGIVTKEQFESMQYKIN